VIEHRIQLRRVIDLPPLTIDTVGPPSDDGQRFVAHGSVFSQRLYVIRVWGHWPPGIYCVVLEGQGASGRSQSDSWQVPSDGSPTTELTIDVELQGRSFTEFTIRVARQDLPETPSPLPS